MVVQLNKVFEYSAQKADWFSAGPDLDSTPDTLFLERTSFDLAKLGKKDSWAILVESYSGDEEREFKGKFDPKKLNISRVNLRLGEHVLADVIQVNYNGSEFSTTQRAPSTVFTCSKKGS